MTNKSTLAKLLALILAFSLFAVACGSSDSDDSGESASTGEAGQTDDGDDAPADDGDDGDDAPADDGDDEVELTQDGGSLLDAVQARGTLNCGVSGAGVGFSVPDANGVQQGFDADMCRATAAAMLGSAESVNLVPLTAAERFTAVQTGEVDMLHRNTTWTQSRDTDVGMDFGPTTYYDGQQIMGRASDGFDGSSGVADIDGAVVCTNAGTTTEKNVNDAVAAVGASITLNTFEDFDIVTQNFIDGACDLITTDGSGLVGRKASQQPDGEEWVIFPATPISKEPLGPTYGQNDSAFADAANWAIYAMIIAEENGVTSANVDDMAANPPTAEIGRLLGGEGELQSLMGLQPDAFLQVIKQVGNYGEVFDRHLTPLGITREGSANALWTDGGLIYAPPAR